ncbi:hypothetical protein N7468_004231 [Penicillium chermesinum]|uniref:Exosome complex exonuclease Rrp40 n=1 Tax=Penicillium chermesinum TaxID=63820 RepID=A0A9W9P876_9EURO|nr:uncharacterized protein N7468_004231 [Penicillium chermesinum]KAJ5239612.1 hypothetical protein N7468_004231 [Penicillium chermesinum]
MSTPLVLLPGDEVPSDHLPPANNNPLKLGPGLKLLSEPTPASEKPRHVLTATQAGILSTDAKRNTVSLLSFPNRRYIPTVNDLVIAQIHHSSADYFHCMVTPHTAHALLGQLSFEGANKKTRPMLKQGELVYARVLSVGLGAGAEVEITCVNPATGKADGGLGPLVGGMVFDITTGMAARLIRASSSSPDDDDAVDGLVVLSELGRKLESIGGFEIAVGRNGKVWVDCSNAGDSAVKATIALGRCLQGTDEHNLNPADQKKLVSKVLREFKLA